MITLSAFRHWLAHARPGEAFIYHTGDLQYDRGSNPQIEQSDATMLGRVADAAYLSYLDGDVILHQKRKGKSEWDYICTRRQRSRPRRIEPRKWK